MRTGHITIARTFGDVFRRSGRVRVRSGGRAAALRPACLRQARRRLLVSALCFAFFRPRPPGGGRRISWRPSCAFGECSSLGAGSTLSPDLVAAAATRKRAPVGPPYDDHFGCFFILGARRGRRRGRVSPRQNRLRTRSEHESIGREYPAARRPKGSHQPTAARARPSGVDGRPVFALIADEATPSAASSGISASDGGFALAGLQQRAEIR